MTTQTEAQPTIDLSRLEPFVSGIGKAILQELKEDLAAQPAAQRSGCTAGTDEECTQRGCATKCPQIQPAAQPTGLIVPKHFDPLTGAGIPDPTTFGEKQ
jgi:hypothetical protein